MHRITLAAFAAGLLMSAGYSANAQPAPGAIAKASIPAKIAATDLKADLALLWRVCGELHPGLFRYNTREQIEANFASLDGAFDRELTVPEAFLALSRFTAAIQCGHTFPNPYNQSTAVETEVLMRPDRVPFYFRWLDGRMIITRDFSGNAAMKPGTEVLSINGTPAGVILSTLLAIARADGSNDAKRISLLAVTGSERYETFDIYFPLLFPQRGSAYELKVRSPRAADEATITVAPLTFEARLAAHKAMKAAPEDADAALWKLSYLEDGTAYLPMASWVAYKTKWDWRRFINETFDELIAKHTANLVIDLRGNEGGSGVGEVILARLIESPQPLSPNQRFVRYVKTPPDLSAALDTWDDSFRDWGTDAVGPVDLADRDTGLPARTTARFYRLRDGDANEGPEKEKMIVPTGKRYAGRIMVIVDATNSSATFEFALMMKQLKLGTLIGQPTGGNQRGINGGAFFFVRLPKSGIEVDLPVIGYFPKPGSGLRDDAGVVPDVLVAVTIDNIAGQVDGELEAVKRILQNTK